MPGKRQIKCMQNKRYWCFDWCDDSTPRNDFVSSPRPFAQGINEIDMQIHELTSSANHIGTQNRL